MFQRVTARPFDLQLHADPTDLLDAPEVPADPPPATAPGVDDDRVMISREELAQYQMAQRAYVARLENERNAPAPVAPTPAPGGDEAEYWANPTEYTRKQMQASQAQMREQFAAQMHPMLIRTFKDSKAADPYGPGTMPFFDKEIAAHISPSYLGSLNPAQQQQVLDIAWRAALGAYVEDARKKKPAPVPPANISGGGGSGGGNTRPAGNGKTLEQISPKAYAVAVSKGWTKKRMDEMAREIEEDR